MVEHYFSELYDPLNVEALVSRLKIDSAGFVEIYSFESGHSEWWLVMKPDGSLKSHCENSRWSFLRKDAQGSDEIVAIDEAKRRWPQLSPAIDRALALVVGRC